MPALQILAAAGLGLLTLPAAAAPASATPTCSGVTVVVDTGADVAVRCAAGDPASGLDALHAAGFTTTPVASFPAALCRIDDVPATGSCRGMPRASAYWSSWSAGGPGGTAGRWTYRSVGPADADPAPGEVEGWAFGAGDPPRRPPVPLGAGPGKTVTAQPGAGRTGTAQSGGARTGAAQTGAGGAAGTVAGAGLIAALGAAGAWVAHRRRAAGRDGR